LRILSDDMPFCARPAGTYIHGTNLRKDHPMKRLFGGQETTTGHFPVEHTEAEWRARLEPAQFNVLRKHATERAGTSPLNAEKRPGTFVCAGCGKKLFASDTKFESGTGWPSFFKPLDGSVGTTEDHCGGHLGHVFPDGPRPTGLRYCMNGVAMEFKPEG
jgi:peptide-methionine (R)-S-oxide reductase